MKAKLASVVLFLSTLSILSTPPARSGSTDSEFSMGAQLYRKKEFTRALSHFQSALKTGSNKADTRYYIALCYQGIGDVEQAVAEYRILVKAFPKTMAAKQAAQALSRLTPDSVRNSASSRSFVNEKQPTDRGNRALPVLHTRFNGTREGRNSRSLPAKDEVYTVSYQKDPDSGHMYLPAKINGRETNMLFDTGASITTCTQSFLDKTGIKVSRLGGQQTVTGVAGEVSAFRAAAKVSIGSLTREIPLLVTADDQSSETLPILGQSFLRDLVYQIDGRNKKITFSFSDPAPRTSRSLAREIPFTTDGDNIIISVVLNGRSTEMILDTGAELVTFADRHMARYGFNRPTGAKFSDSRRAIGGRLREYLFTIDSIKVGPVKKETVRATVMINSNFVRPLLGQSFLSELTYTVDPARRIVRFEGRPPI